MYNFLTLIAAIWGANGFKVIKVVNCLHELSQPLRQLQLLTVFSGPNQTTITDFPLFSEHQHAPAPFTSCSIAAHVSPSTHPLHYSISILTVEGDLRCLCSFVNKYCGLLFGKYICQTWFTTLHTWNHNLGSYSVSHLFSCKHYYCCTKTVLLQRFYFSRRSSVLKMRHKAYFHSSQNRKTYK